ncbi:MAG: molybdopterin-synthase adenylyltransferase MoeB [Gemmatimonadota bacterium]|jgi:adenylyltransferase/sulfurtransferase
MSDATEPRASTDPRPRGSPTRGLPELSREELIRYARHLALPDVGEEGQRRLAAGRVLCVGAGGLGSPLALYLAAAGVGTLGLVDFDRVDATNLQRQILHGTSDVGRSKLDSAAETLADVNPRVEVIRHDTRLTSENALEVLEPYDVVVDGTDNFPTRYLVNDACVLLGKPNVYGSVFRWEGQLSVFAAPEGWSGRSGDRGPCYRCLFRQPPPPDLVQDCAEGGVLGVLPGTMGCLQAVETVKWLLGRGRPMVGRLLIFDALGLEWREVEVRRDPACPVCGDEPTQNGLIDYELFCGTAAAAEGGEAAPGFIEVTGVSAAAAGDGSAPTRGTDGPTSSAPGRIPQTGAAEVAVMLQGDDPPLLVDVREPWEWRIGNLEAHGAVLIPLGDLEDRMHEIPRERELVMVCRTGVRSRDAAVRLAREGFPRVHNLRGGLVAWRARVDPGVDVV